MLFDDFCKYFQYIFISHVLQPQWHRKFIVGEWTKETAGGSGGQWYKNPQYIMTVDKPTRVLINVAQEDARLTVAETGISTDGHIVLVLQKHPQKGSKKRVYRRDAEVLMRPHRETTVEAVLLPGENYVAIPALFVPTPGQFYMSIFSENEVEMLPAEGSDEAVAIAEGAWTCGRCGAYNTPSFVDQEQFVLDFEGGASESVPFSYCLIQNTADTPLKQPMRVSIMLLLISPDVQKLDAETKNRSDVLLCTDSKRSYTFESLWFNDASLPSQDDYRYLIIPTLFDPVPDGTCIRYTLIFICNEPNAKVRLRKVN
jgi:hypothetical protein